MDPELSAWKDNLRGKGVLPEGMKAAMLAGSSARGWHDARSDFDVYLVTDRPWSSEGTRSFTVPLEPSTVGTESFYVGSRRWEISYWLDTQVGQLIEKVSWEAFRSDLMAGDALTAREETFLSRLSSAVALEGEDWIRQRKAELHDSAFRSFLVARSLGFADGCVEDALGQLESGSAEGATLAARQAFHHAIDALLEAKGEYGSAVQKWLPYRVRAAQPLHISFAEYWAVETMQTYDPADPARWINEVLTLCQDISMKIEV
ncbi:hypothetical protein [Jatrophihabitans sp.]|uniref:hypothetical protein n=1 Tax=Jatrophihabitans sp. TaxID=1932789 RepID=UPI002CB80A1D|nr:hypothetical protein [Jatrophihabitans sp.]